MFWFKRCPRCSGDLYEEQDQYGPFINCVQCGLNKDIRGTVVDPSHMSLELVPVPALPQPEGDRRRRLSHGGRHMIGSRDRASVSTAAA
jgi:hypothetical protein